jgi:2-polyprenyl-3-methyl-5-hydroxy-6-metoxy-1,4-benzoquinol methylase
MTGQRLPSVLTIAIFWISDAVEVCKKRGEAMTPEEVGKSYDLLAERWNSESFPRQNGIDAHRRAMAFIECGNTALDIGCGSNGRFIDLLLEANYQLEGLDISPKMIELAKKRHPQITFHQADICHWNFPKQYDFITAWDSIWHIPLNEQASVLNKIFAALSPGGVLIFTTGGLDQPSDTQDSTMGPPMYHSVPGIPQIFEWLKDSNCVCRHLEYDQHPERHVYIIVQKLAEED